MSAMSIEERRRVAMSVVVSESKFGGIGGIVVVEDEGDTCPKEVVHLPYAVTVEFPRVQPQTSEFFPPDILDMRNDLSKATPTSAKDG